MDQDILDKYILAGKIASRAITQGSTLIKVGASMREVLDQIEQDIKKRGGGIAFPAQIAVNDIAAHFCPTEKEDYIFKEGDVCKLDIGVHIEGYIADTALTVNLGGSENDNLVLASKEALDAALAIIKPGVTLGEIGRAIHDTIKARGLQPIHNLSGHGLGRYQIHTKPSVPNFDTGDNTALPAGTVIAIEPFASTGAGEIYESNKPTIFSLVANRPVRSKYAREVLKTIKTFENLPFTTRWLSRMHGVGATNFALRELLGVGNLISHAPLPDKDHGLVSQHEHTVIVFDEPIVTTKR